MNPLESNPRARLIAYQVFWVVALLLGATQVGYATLEQPAPAWLKVALSVLAFVGAGIGYTAAHNVETQPPLHDTEIGQGRLWDDEKPL